MRIEAPQSNGGAIAPDGELASSPLDSPPSPVTPLRSRWRRPRRRARCSRGETRSSGRARRQRRRGAEVAELVLHVGEGIVVGGDVHNLVLEPFGVEALVRCGALHAAGFAVDDDHGDSPSGHCLLALTRAAGRTSLSSTRGGCRCGRARGWVRGPYPAQAPRPIKTGGLRDRAAERLPWGAQRPGA